MAGLKRGRSKSNLDGERDKKKKKAKQPSLAAQRTVSVIVKLEDSETTFQLHADTLSVSSFVLGEKLAGIGPEVEIKPLILDDVSLESFTTFSRWIYARSDPTDGIAVDELDDDDESEGGSDEQDAAQRIGAGNGEQTSHAEAIEEQPKRRDRVFRRLVDLYVFGARYDCPDLRLAVIFQLQRCVNDWEKLPGPNVLKHVLENLELDAPLCRYLIVCYGYYTTYETVSKERLATLPSQVLAAILEVTFKRADGDDDVPEVDENWCDFHEHGDDHKRKECENSRPRDPDMVSKQLVRWRALRVRCG